VRRFRWLVLGAAALFLGGFAYERFWKAPSPEELERLRQRRRLLADRLRDRLARDVRLLEVPEASVVVGVPARVAEGFLGDVVQALLSDVRLTLRGLEVHKEGEVRGRLLVGRTRLGRYAVRVSFHEVRATLRAGKPRLRFAGERVAVRLPVSLAGGEARGRLSFRWDGRGVAGAVCGDVEVAGEVAGTARPATYSLEGSLRLVAEEAALVARPEFEATRVTLRVEPSRETWGLVERTIREQGAVCRAALGAADVPEKIRGLLDRGFGVTLPATLFREVRLPVAMERSVGIGEAEVRLRVAPVGLALTPQRLWYGAAVSTLPSPDRGPPPVPVAAGPPGAPPRGAVE